MPLAIGQVLYDRYRIDGMLGQGGMGAVYRAWDLRLDIPLAIKENLDASPEAQKQFGREAQILARLSHPNLPRVTDTFFIPGQGQYLVMDYVAGEDCEALLARLGVLPEPQVLDWIAQVCDALAYLHSQPAPIIHRDIKPANIKIRPDGRAMLVDFGIAKVYDPHLATTIGAKAVTPGFSPPEQYGGGTTDARSDIYALGATLYTLLTGQRPLESVERAIGKTMPAPRLLNGGISMFAEQAILRAIEVSTDRRFQTVEELRSALTQPSGSALFPALATRKITPQQRRAISPWIWLAIPGAALLLVIVFFSSGSFQRVPATPSPVSGSPTVARPVAVLPIQSSPTRSPTQAATRTPLPANPTRSPTWTATRRLPTATSPGVLFDDFLTPAHEGKFDPHWWAFFKGSPVNDCSASQAGGALVVSQVNGSLDAFCGLRTLEAIHWRLQDLSRVETRLKLDTKTGQGWAAAVIDIESREMDWSVTCHVGQFGQEDPYRICWTSEWSKNSNGPEGPSGFSKTQLGQWYDFRIEVDPRTAVFSFYIDNRFYTAYTPAFAARLKDNTFTVTIGVNGQADTTSAGAVDNVLISPYH